MYLPTTFDYVKCSEAVHLRICSDNFYLELVNSDRVLPPPEIYQENILEYFVELRS